MPVTLPQLSRRAFLKRAALAASAAALAPQSYAGLFGKSRDKHTFALLSDTHIGPSTGIVHNNVNMADNLAGVGRQLAAWPVKPAAIIINGDLAFAYGKSEDYATFSNLIHPLRGLAPLHLSLGNHDNHENFWQAFPRDAARLDSVPQKQATCFASEHANWFLLDSLEVTTQTPGLVGSAQLEWLVRELKARPNKPALVVCHHPLDVTGLMGLKDSLAMEQVLMQHPQVMAFIFGHTHNWNITQHPSGVHLINLPQTAYAFQQGRPSGWVRATLAKDGAEFELRCLDEHHPEHAKVKKLTWRTA